MSFEYQPVLKSDLVELRPLRSDDYASLYEVAADPLIWEQHPVKHRHEESFKSFFRESLAAPENVRSQRAVEKLGGNRVGSRPDTGGRLSYVYELTESGPTATE